MPRWLIIVMELIYILFLLGTIDVRTEIPSPNFIFLTHMTYYCSTMLRVIPS